MSIIYGFSVRASACIVLNLSQAFWYLIYYFTNVEIIITSCNDRLGKFVTNVSTGGRLYFFFEERDTGLVYCLKTLLPRFFQLPLCWKEMTSRAL